MPSASYNAGGQDYFNASNPANGSISETLGRVWNNLSGTTANNMAQAREAELARASNSAEAAKQRDWETYMSNTAYQRAAADMKAAGINPMALGGGSSPASTPSGASANSPAAALHSGGSGGFAGIIGKVAQAAIAGALASKFRNTANKAKSEGGQVAQAVNQAAKSEIVSANKAMSHHGWNGKQTSYIRNSLAASKQQLYDIARTRWVDD